jgi:hypothetical protein
VQALPLKSLALRAHWAAHFFTNLIADFSMSVLGPAVPP